MNTLREDIASIAKRDGFRVGLPYVHQGQRVKWNKGGILGEFTADRSGRMETFPEGCSSVLICGSNPVTLGEDYYVAVPDPVKFITEMAMDERLKSAASSLRTRDCPADDNGRHKVARGYAGCVKCGAR